MREAFKRLEKLHALVTADLQEDGKEQARRVTVEDELARHIAELPPYKQAEYHCTVSIAKLRTALRNTCVPDKRTGEPQGSESDRDGITTRQAARKSFQSVQKWHREARRLAREAAAVTRGHNGTTESPQSNSNYADDFHELNKHVELATEWYRESFGIVVASSAIGVPSRSRREDRQPLLCSTFVAGRDAALHTTTTSPPRCDNLSAHRGLPLHITREDEAFAAFFESIKEKDALIDAVLDRIAVGVDRLHENAVHIGDELDRQQVVLQDVEVRVDHNAERLEQLNNRLHHAFQEVDRPILCVYALCFCLFIVVLGTLVYVLMWTI